MILSYKELWDEIGYSETERLGFKPMLVTEEGFTDELLQQHTQEADKLTTKFETMKHILEVTWPASLSFLAVDVVEALEGANSEGGDLCLTSSVPHRTAPFVTLRRKSKSAKPLSSSGSSTRPARKTRVASGLREANKSAESNAEGEVAPSNLVWPSGTTVRTCVTHPAPRE